MDAVREEARNDMARAIREVEAQTKDEADKRAREIVVEVMQRVATDTVAERTVSTIEESLVFALPPELRRDLKAAGTR